MTIYKAKRKGWEVVCMDESVFVYYSVIRWVWAKKGSKPVVLTTGSHKRTCLFGALGMDGRQLFRQYSKINGEFFPSFLREMKRKWKRFYLFIDGPSWHKSNKVRHFFEENQDSVVPVWFPTCSPELNPVEEPWRQLKDELQANRLHSSFDEMKRAIGEKVRTKRFKVDVVKYLIY